MYEELIQHYLGIICTSDDYESDGRCSNPDLLFPPFKEKIDAVIAEYKRNHENAPEFFETFRSNARQYSCYKSGASNIKTNGMHHYGIAVDLVGKNKKGKFDYAALNYPVIRSTAKGLGLTLLNMEDCHVQFIPVEQQIMLRRAVLEGIIEFQREHDLKPDGIVGPKTIEALKIAYVPDYTPKTENS